MFINNVSVTVAAAVILWPQSFILWFICMCVIFFYRIISFLSFLIIELSRHLMISSKNNVNIYCSSSTALDRAFMF